MDGMAGAAETRRCRAEVTQLEIFTPGAQNSTLSIELHAIYSYHVVIYAIV
jgi:hypothetical protein